MQINTMGLKKALIIVVFLGLSWSVFGQNQHVPLKEGLTFKDCDNCPEMVVIPSGSFLMGSILGTSDELPEHLVDISSFSISKFEITQEQWHELMGNRPSNFQGGTLPVEQVTILDIEKFIQRLNVQTGKTYRLPSEAEWEYAARGGSQTEFFFGNDERELIKYAWFEDNSYGQTQPVGMKLPNRFGLHDMLGNVSEWTQDCWSENYADKPKVGNEWLKANCSERVFRGGSWIDNPRNLRSTDRDSGTANITRPTIGFRLARTP